MMSLQAEDDSGEGESVLSSRSNRGGLQLAALALASTIFCFGQRLNPSAAVNTWSVCYLHWRMEGVPDSTLGAAPPDWHARAPIWLSMDALEDDQIRFAEVVLAPALRRRDPLALHQEGEIFETEGDLRRAIQVWAAAGDVSALLNLAESEGRDGHLGTALAAYHAALDAGGEGIVGFFAHFLANDLGSPREAETILLEAIRTFPRSHLKVTWLVNLGIVREELEDWAGAEWSYREALDLDSAAWQAQVGLGRVAYRAGKGAARAISDIRLGIQMAPDMGDGYLAIAEILTNEGSYQEADYWFREAIRRNSQAKGWWLLWGNAALRSGELDTAIEVYGHASQRFPQLSDIYYQMAMAYRLDGDAGMAVSSIEKAIELESRPRADYFLRAGQIFEYANEGGAAKDAYSRALEINPGLGIAEERLQRLEDQPAK